MYETTIGIIGTLGLVVGLLWTVGIVVDVIRYLLPRRKFDLRKWEAEQRAALTSWELTQRN